MQSVSTDKFYQDLSVDTWLFNLLRTYFDFSVLFIVQWVIIFENLGLYKATKNIYLFQGPVREKISDLLKKSGRYVQFFQESQGNWKLYSCTNPGYIRTYKGWWLYWCVFVKSKCDNFLLVYIHIGSFHVKWMKISKAGTWPISDPDETFTDERYV